MDKVSIIIPARNEIWLNKTVEDLLSKATGNIEIIVVLDGYLPSEFPKSDKRLKILHKIKPEGMRSSINYASNIAGGKYLMKIDAHCMIAEGFDEVLQKNCEYTDISVPSRYSLHIEEWKKGYGPIEYLYITFPYEKHERFGQGLHGVKWLGKNGLGGLGSSEYFYMERLKSDMKIDEIQTWQGSCWFMHKQRFFDLGQLDNRFYNIYQEAQELGFKTWLSNGKLIVNKNTWYAHWHRKSDRGFKMSVNKMRDTSKYSTWYWMNDKWEGQKRKMRWFIEKFWPIPSWPENWEEIKIKFEKENDLELLYNER